MNEWELFDALTDLDDDILTELPPKQKRGFRKGVSIGLLAAVIALLATTAFAVTSGIRRGQQTVALEGVSLRRNAPSETATYYTAEVACTLEPVEIRQMDTLSTALTAAWEDFPYDAEYFNRAELVDAAGKRVTFASLTEAGAYFGLRLPYSPNIDRMTHHVTVTMVISDTDRAQSEYRETGAITPDGLILQCVLRRGGDGLDTDTVATGTLTVYVALHERFAAQNSVQILSSHEKEGNFHEFGMLTDDGKSLLLLENDPQDGLSATGYAIWCSDGIACRAELKTLPNTTATPLSLLTPLLKDIQ